MKTGKIFWGVGFILVAVALILDALGVLAPFTSVVGDISLLAILAALLLLSYTISKLCHGRVGEIFIPLALIFMLFEKNIAMICGLNDTNIINNWLLIGCAALLWIGFSILFPGHRHKHRKNGHIRVKSGSNLTSGVTYIDASRFDEEYVENNLGSLVVRFENVNEYKGCGVLYVDNNLGSTVIEVPSSWRFAVSIDNSLGSVSAPSDAGDEDAPLLLIKGDNNLGSVSVKFV